MSGPMRYGTRFNGGSTVSVAPGTQPRSGYDRKVTRELNERHERLALLEGTPEGARLKRARIALASKGGRKPRPVTLAKTAADTEAAR